MLGRPTRGCPNIALLHRFGGPPSWPAFHALRYWRVAGASRIRPQNFRVVERRRAASTSGPSGTAERSPTRGPRAGASGVVAFCSSPRTTPRRSLRRDAFMHVFVVREWITCLVHRLLSTDDLVVAASGSGAVDLLFGWRRECVLTGRDRIRLRLLNALGALSLVLPRARRRADAVDAAMLARSSVTPQERAQPALIEAHVVQGNWLAGQEIGRVSTPSHARVPIPTPIADARSTTQVGNSERMSHARSTSGPMAMVFS